MTTNALASLGNFALSISLARTLSLSDLGQFAVAFALFTLITGFIRASVCEPLLARGADRHGLTQGSRRSSIISLSVLPLVLILGLIADMPYLVVIAIAIHGLTLYDFSITMNLAAHNRNAALIQEGCRFISSVAVGGLVNFEIISGLTAFALWAAAGVFIGYTFSISQGFSLVPGWKLDREQTRTSAAFGGDFLIGSGSSQIAFNLVGTTAGLGAVGALRAGGTLLGPVSLVISSARSLAIPYLARNVRKGKKQGTIGALAGSAVIGAATLPLLALISFLPDSVGRLLLSDNWDFARPVIGLLALEMAFISLTTVPFAGLRALLAGRITLIVRSSLAFVRIVAVVGAATIGGAIWAAIAMAAISGIGMFVWWTGYLYALAVEERNR